jgi:hypothetical protein
MKIIDQQSCRWNLHRLKTLRLDQSFKTMQSCGQPGYATVIERSCERKGIVKLICDLGGQYRNSHNITEATQCCKTATRKSGCLLTAGGKHYQFTKCWEPHVSEPAHTREPSDSPCAHLTLRRLDVEEIQQIGEMRESGGYPQTVMGALRSQGHNAVVERDIHNAQLQLRADALQRRTQAQTLLHQLNTDNFL